MKKNLLLIAICSLFFFSCDTGIEPTPPVKTQTIMSAEVDRAFVEAFDPVYKAGLKYTYISTNSIEPTKQEESSSEVLSITGEKLKVKLSNGKGGSEIKEGPLKDFSEGLPEKGILNQGFEDIKVLAGEYKNCTVVEFNFVYSYTVIETGVDPISGGAMPTVNPDGTKKEILAKSKLWLYKGVGAIKRVDYLPNSAIVTTELKEFKNPN